jgi:hypothetical protein
MGSVDAPTPNKHHREADREEYSVDADRELATAQEALAAAEASARASGAFLAEAETDARRRHSVVHADTLARLVDSGSAVERASTLAALALGPEDDRWAAAAVLLDDANDPLSFAALWLRSSASATLTWQVWKPGRNLFGRSNSFWQDCCKSRVRKTIGKPRTTTDVLTTVLRPELLLVRRVRAVLKYEVLEFDHVWLSWHLLGAAVCQYKCQRSSVRR